MARAKLRDSIIFAIILLFSFNMAYPYTAPDPAKTFYADANGDQQLQSDDLPLHKLQVYLGYPAYNTPQLNNVDDRWNTCDVTGDFRCQNDDMAPLKAAVYLNPLAKNWDSWEIVNISFPTTANVGETKSFQISPRAFSGGVPNARPGIIVKLTVAPDSPAQNVTLGGRACQVVDPKCAVSVGITSWQTSTALAPTETGTAEFSFTANDSGNLILVAEFAAQPTMKIAATSVRFTATIIVDEVDILCPDTDETAEISCPVISSTGLSDCMIGAGDTCGGSIDSACVGPYTAPAQGEPAGPGTCVAEVVKGTATDSDTVDILEVNQSPYFTSTPPTTAREGVPFSYTNTFADNDLPDWSMTDPGYVSYIGVWGNTCGPWLNFIGFTAYGIPDENAGGTMCAYNIEIFDGYGAHTVQMVGIYIEEANQLPYFTSTAPVSATEGVPFSYNPAYSDNDLPNSLVNDPGHVACQGITGNTCGAWLSLAGCNASGTPTQAAEGTNCGYTINVVDGYGATASQTVALSIIDVWNDGPQIVYNPAALPLPDIPFPNDVLTVADATTVTGRRLNVGTSASTQLERDMRTKINVLDGWGAYTPMYIRFNEPLNLSTVTDGNVMLVKLDAPNQGALVPLDLGKGFTPTIWRPDHFWGNDPMTNANNILMNPNNVADLNGDTVAEFVDFYEYETNTLIMRPIYPMDESSRYAVVLLKNIKGTDGNAVWFTTQSINDPSQTTELAPLEGILSGKGISFNQVAFCWSFTTQSVTPEWVNIWKGLHDGQGALGYMATDFSPVLHPSNLEVATDADGSFYTLEAHWFKSLIDLLTTMAAVPNMLGPTNFGYTDYFVFGKYNSPTFFERTNFGNPLIVDPISFEQAKLNGTSRVTTSLSVTWMLGVPKDEDLGLDGCQSEVHPRGCKDFEESGAQGEDGGYGVAGIDDNHDGYVDDAGEYLWPGSDDVFDPAGDNYDPNTNPTGTQGNGILDYDFGFDGKPGIADVDDDHNGIVDDITEFGWPGGDDGYSEDANLNGRLDTPPFPVAFYGHGHTLNYIEGLAFIDAVNRNGIALLAIDDFGHGPMSDIAKMDQTIKNALKNTYGMNLNEVCRSATPSASCNQMLDLLRGIGVDINHDRAINWADIDGRTISGIVDEMMKQGLFKILASDGRGYDTNADGYKDSGVVFFTGNIFQTRDCVRQTAIDFMQLSRIVDHFGLQSTDDLNGDTVPDLDGDFNLDGVVDVGGPPATMNPQGFYWLGSSLGGIMGDVNMAVNPRVTVGAPVSGAGGLPDVISRGHQRSATEPALLQSFGPVIVGTYKGTAGKVTLTFNNDTTSSGTLTIPTKGRVQVTNMVNSETRTVTSDAQGNFSVGIPADTGNSLRIVSLDAKPSPVTVNLSAKYHGFGLVRNTPNFRKFFTLVYTVLDRADPVNLAKHYFTNARGAPFTGYPDKKVLLIMTNGDNSVPVASGNAIATAAGVWTLAQAQPIIDNGYNIGYVPESGYGSPVYDPEDVDDDGLKCGFELTNPLCNPLDPGIAPLPPISTADGVSAVRFHFVEEVGHHAFAMPNTINHGIDWGIYMLNQIGYFHASDGKCVIDDPFELHASAYISPGPDKVLDTTASNDDTIHTIRLISTLGLNDCDYPFPTVQIIGPGPNGVIDSTPSNDDVLLDYANLYRGP